MSAHGCPQVLYTYSTLPLNYQARLLAQAGLIPRLFKLIKEVRYGCRMVMLCVHTLSGWAEDTERDPLNLSTYSGEFWHVCLWECQVDWAMYAVVPDMEASWVSDSAHQGPLLEPARGTRSRTMCTPLAMACFGN